MKFVFFILFFLITNVVNAEDHIPSSCKPVVVAGETVMVSTKKPLLIMIHNLSNSDLWIIHPASDSGAGAGWSSRLQAGNWSALALDKKAFVLNCIESRPGHEQQIPCQGVISACRWPKITMPAKETGTYWAGENMSLANLKEHLGGRGFELPDSSD